MSIDEASICEDEGCLVCKVCVTQLEINGVMRQACQLCAGCPGDETSGQLEEGSSGEEGERGERIRMKRACYRRSLQRINVEDFIETEEALEVLEVVGEDWISLGKNSLETIRNARARKMPDLPCTE